MKTDTKEVLVDNNLILTNMSTMGHEQIVFCQDKEVGLKAIIAIHDTTLGPALGGTRMWNYANEQDAFEDVLRLSRGMTFKASISGLNLGGGKAVIIGDSSKEKTESLMRRFGQFVDSLGGKYITAEDVGMSTKDMEHVLKETRHVTGIPENMGGSGDPSPVTAYGVYMGMKAAANYRWGNDSLKGKSILVQGVGHVGEHLVKHLQSEDAHVIINDINSELLNKVSLKYNTDVELGDAIYDLDIDIYAPCALGATLNPGTISRLRCSVVAGAANNQLEDEYRDSNLLLNRKIVYAPDFLINAGGLINVYSEINGYNKINALKQTEEIYNTTLKILSKSESESITTHAAALMIAKERISKKRSYNNNVK
tara:strand:- start:4670 stop:5773 length:1104 start_codon:yes stop_codon:yes gene_type:complete